MRILAALILSTAAVAAALYAYERSVARPALEKLWGRVRSGDAPMPDPDWAFLKRLQGWLPYLTRIVDSPASDREAQLAAVGVAVVVFFPVVVWVGLAVWLYQMF